MLKSAKAVPLSMQRMPKDSKVSSGSKESVGLSSIFPNASELISADFTNVTEVLNDCVVILDTNALLVPYNIGPQSLEQIHANYSRLAQSGRLVVPGQVVREFVSNRPLKLAEIYKTLNQKRSFAGPKSGTPPLLRATSSFANVLQIESELRELIDKYKGAVANLVKEVEAWTWNDPVSLMYRDVISSSVVVDPEFDEHKLKERWHQCVEHKLPPGYKDASKEMNSDGDLRIWMTILEIAETRKKHAVFVSGDSKADWWHRSDSSPLYPRFELVDEYRRKSDGYSFHIVQFSRFLELFGATTETVSEVAVSERTIAFEKLSQNSRFSASAMLAEQAVYDWLSATFPSLALEASTDPRPGIDFYLSDPPEGITTAVIVKYLRRPQASLRHIIMRTEERLSNIDSVENALIIIVVDQPEEFDQLKATLQRIGSRKAKGISLLPSFLNSKNQLNIEDIFGELTNL